jgi:hypothetical protein
MHGSLILLSGQTKQGHPQTKQSQPQIKNWLALIRKVILRCWSTLINAQKPEFLTVTIQV